MWLSFHLQVEEGCVGGEEEARGRGAGSVGGVGKGAEGREVEEAANPASIKRAAMTSPQHTYSPGLRRHTRRTNHFGGFTCASCVINLEDSSPLHSTTQSLLQRNIMG